MHDASFQPSTISLRDDSWHVLTFRRPHQIG